MDGAFNVYIWISSYLSVENSRVFPHAVEWWLAYTTQSWDASVSDSECSPRFWCGPSKEPQKWAYFHGSSISLVLHCKLLYSSGRPTSYDLNWYYFKHYGPDSWNKNVSGIFFYCNFVFINILVDLSCWWLAVRPPMGAVDIYERSNRHGSNHIMERYIYCVLIKTTRVFWRLF